MRIPDRKLPLAIALLSTFSAHLVAQSSPPPVAFDVASVKLSSNQPGSRAGFCVLSGAPGFRGGPGTPDPQRITASHVSLKELLVLAYGVHPFQVVGPDWIDPPLPGRCGDPRCDVIANVPGGAAKADVPAMWRTLLQDRFGVVAHRESRTVQGEALVVLKGGPSLRASVTGTPGSSQPADGSAKIQVDDSGCAVAFPGIVETMSHETGRTMLCLAGKAQSLDQLAAYLEKGQDHPVWDRTGLTGLYDFTLKFGPASAARRPMDALEPQLGLKLVPVKADLNMLVVDKANKSPTAN